MSTGSTSTENVGSQSLDPANNTPALRFKGCEGKWKERKLGELGDTYSGLSGKTKSDFGHGDARYIIWHRPCSLI